MKIIPITALPFPKAVIFDWDNTIVDSRIVLHETMLILAEQIAMPIEKIRKTEVFCPNFNRPVIEAFPRIFGNNWQSMWEKASKIMKENRFRLMKLIPRSVEFINILEENGIPMAVVSNKEEEFLRDEVDHFGILEKFFRVCPCIEGELHKPAPEAAYRAFDPEIIARKDYNNEIWFIGDSSVDIQCACAAGCSAILYGSVDHSGKDFQGTEGVLASSFAKLIDYYQELKVKVGI